MTCTCADQMPHTPGDPRVCIYPAPVPASPEGPDEGLREDTEVIVGALDNLYRDVRSNPDITDQGYAEAAGRIRRALAEGSLRLVSAPLLTAERERARRFIEQYETEAVHGFSDQRAEAREVLRRWRLSATDPGSSE